MSERGMISVFIQLGFGDMFSDSLLVIRADMKEFALQDLFKSLLQVRTSACGQIFVTFLAGHIIRLGRTKIRRPF